MDVSRKDLLLACGAVGPPLFIAAFLREGSTRPDYDPRRFPVSSLAIGERGWRQTANFLMIGTALVACSRGMRPGWEARLLGIAGVGLLGAGVFTTDPVFGYPPTAPLLLDQESRSGRLHNIASALFFAGVPGACFVSGRRAMRAGEGPWAAYSLLSGVAMLVTFVLAGAGFAQRPRLVARAGILQRLSIGTGLTWVALRAAGLLRSARS